MYCPQCGKPIIDGSKFCVHCGAPISESPDLKYVQAIQLRCKNCGGTMTIDQDNQVLACKYCGSKELIVENSKVTIERIRSTTARDIREIDYKQHESQKDLELEKLYYEENKAIRKDKREWKMMGRAWLIILVMFLALGGLIYVENTLRDKEIAAGKIPIPSDGESYIGVQHQIVELELRDAGFTNILSKPLNDLSEASIEDDGKIYKILVNGNTDFKARTLFFPDVKIFIYYHSTNDTSS